MTFYDEIATGYDKITGAARRGKVIEAFVERFLERYPTASAVDAATGTGAYAIALAKAGVSVIGTDISAAMVDEAASAALRVGLNLHWMCVPMQDLAGRVEKPVDAVLCMGNSLPHLTTADEIETALTAFAKITRDGGTCVLQLLNYDRVTRLGERIVGIDRSGEQTFVRFYDFLGDQLRFNILEISWAGEQATHMLHSTTLYPWKADEIAGALARCGWTNIQRFGGLDFCPYHDLKSETVLLIAKRISDF
ncbi:MAG: class I SAM-dependent methyltransferase [Planctomycetaceae bacterium]|nr:class I SAM-dependent methyltransferase [Planctomycetaceae bacterium]